MSQFGGSKNPPWSSLGSGNAGGHPQVLQAQHLMGLSPSAGLYNQQIASSAGGNSLAMQAQMQATAMQVHAQAAQAQAMQPQATHVMAMQQPLGAQGMAVAVTAPSSQLNVSYPPRQSQAGQPKQRVFTGMVTKLHDTFGFVDEDVFFQTSTVKGLMPKVAERVLVEATYNPNMPFKWNATRVQLISNPNQMAPVGNVQPQSGMQPGSMSVNQIMTQQGIITPPSLMAMQMSNQQQGILGNPPQHAAAAAAALNSMSGRRNESDANRRRIDRNREREERERERVREQHDRESRERKREQRDRDHRDQDHRKDKDRDKERERTPPAKRRSRSPRRSPKRPRKPAPRYVVQVPRFPLDISKANVLELRKRYVNLYVPSDFFLADCCYQNAFPLGRPFNTARPCSFYMMPKDVEPLTKNTAVLEPPDVSYQYSAKVMLINSVSEEEFFKNCCARIEDPNEVRDNFQHPARILSFMVGSKGKNEVMAIGGPWSPSLDGPDPANDEGVLIKTAIRTTKALTGVDLSACAQWYRFLEIHYHRGEQKGGRPKPRVETVVVFVPDVWNLVPTKAEWAALGAGYRRKFATRHGGGAPPPDEPAPPQPPQSPPQQQPQTPTPAAAAAKQQKSDEKVKTPEGNETQPQGGGTDGAGEKPATPLTPTHWKELDQKNMKVHNLRVELDSRGVNSKGLKTQLVARLAKVLKREEQEEIAMSEEDRTEDPPEPMDEDGQQPQTVVPATVKEEVSDCREEGQESGKESGKEEEDSRPETVPMEECVKEEENNGNNDQKDEGAPREVKTEEPIDPKEEEERRKKEEKQRQLLERKYTLPETPSIIVHPSPSAKGGRFECTVTNLSVLLDYRPEDTKEHSFEVSLFAELFNELLQRDFAFNIYQAILRAPEKKEPEKKEPEKKDKKKEERREDREDNRKDVNNKKDEDGDEPKTKKRKAEEKDVPMEEQHQIIKTEMKEEGKKSNGLTTAKSVTGTTAAKPATGTTAAKPATGTPAKTSTAVKTLPDATGKPLPGTPGKPVAGTPGKPVAGTTGKPVAGTTGKPLPGAGGKAVSGAAAKTSTDDAKKEEKKKEEKGVRVVGKHQSSSSSQENAPKVKMETVNPTLLLSCVYFDQNHCRFIIDKDLEDLLNCLGLNLSRAQVRKLMHKVLSRDMWNYRRMTDGTRGEKDTKEEGILVKEEHNGPRPEGAYKGNLTLMEMVRSKSGRSRQQPWSEPSSSSSAGLVTYQGAVVDLGSIMSRLKKSEDEQKSAENKINQMQRETDKLRSTASTSQESVKSLSTEVDALRKKLHETEDGLRSSKRRNEDYRSCVEKAQKSIDDVGARFKSVLDRGERDKEDRRDKDKPRKEMPPPPPDKKENNKN